MSAEIPDIGWNSVFPQDRMRGADSSDGNTAGAGDADHLTLVIDRRSGAGGITRQRRKFLHLPVGLPDHRSEPEDLKSGIAGWIVDTIFCPAHYLPAVVRARGVAVVAAWEWRQRRHHAVHPPKALTYFSGGSTRGKKGPARKCLTQGIIFGSVRDAHDQSNVVLDRPGHGAIAVRPSESAQIGGLGGAPQLTAAE